MSIEINEIDALKERRFSGAVKIIFDSGNIKLFFTEEDGENGELNTAPYDAENGKEFRDVKPYSVREIEKIIEAYKVIKEYGTVEPLKGIEQE